MNKRRSLFVHGVREFIILVNNPAVIRRSIPLFRFSRIILNCGYQISDNWYRFKSHLHCSFLSHFLSHLYIYIYNTTIKFIYEYIYTPIVKLNNHFVPTTNISILFVIYVHKPMINFINVNWNYCASDRWPLKWKAHCFALSPFDQFVQWLTTI